MAYRNDLDALEARHKALEAEVAERTRERDEAARMVVEARAREHERAVAEDYVAGGPARRRRQIMAIVVGMAAAVALVIGIAHLAKRPNRAERRLQAIVAQYETYTDELCACASRACSDGVMERMTKWAQGLAIDHDDASMPSEDMMKRFEALADRMSKCMAATVVEPPAEYPSQN